jgi:hypothetical protein
MAVKQERQQPPRNNAATKQRVAVLEALERMGGNVRDDRGVGHRIARNGGKVLTHPNQVHTTLLGLEQIGIVMLDRAPGPRGKAGAGRIIEVQLIEIPEHFTKPIEKLRRERNIKWFYPGERQPEQGNGSVGVVHVEEPVVPEPVVTAEVERDELHVAWQRIAELEHEVERLNVVIDVLAEGLARRRGGA